MRKTLLTLMFAAAVAGCQFHSKSSNPIAELPAKSFKAQWTRDLKLDGKAPRDMYVAGDDLFIYTTDNLLYRMNRLSGDLVYISNAVPAEARVAMPLLLKDRLLIPADTKLYILDARGFKTNTIELKSPMRSGLVGNSKGLYVGIDAYDGTGRLVCVDIDRPNSPFRWQLKTAGSIIATPAVLGDAVYAGSDDGKVYAVDPDRAAVWPLDGSAFVTGGGIHGGITADKSGVYVASMDSKLYCLGLNNGKILWQYFGGILIKDTPAVTNSTVYVHVVDKGVVAIEKGVGAYNRQAKWAVKDAVGFLAENDKLSFLRGRDNSVMAVDKATGELKFVSERRDLVAFAVNTTDGLIYAATEKGKVFAAVAVMKPGAVGELVWVPAEGKPQG